MALLACIAATATPGLAQESTPANVAAARQHFEKARADYEQGAYREAIAELEAAHALDPNAKDLVFNLGVVHEKLADIDDALKWFRLYTTMSLTSQERDRADAYIRRLEGAKTELEQKQAAAQAAQLREVQGSSSARTATAPPPAPPRRGRIDAATIVTASVSGAALAFGVVMAVKAKSDQPPNPFVTPQDGTYTDMTSRVHTAHDEAVLADVGFGVSLAAGIAAAYLYFGRTRAAPFAPPATTGSTTVSATRLPGGGALLVQGSF